MDARINFAKVARGVYEAMLGLEKYLSQCGLEESAPPDQVASLTDQRVRLLPRYALEGPASRWRNRTADVRTRCVGRVSLLL